MESKTLNQFSIQNNDQVNNLVHLEVPVVYKKKQLST